MKIIADTNVWYRLGSDGELLQRMVDLPLTPSFINLKELTKTGSMVEREAAARAAVQAMLLFEDKMILDPPFVHLAKLHQDYAFDGRDAFAEDLEVAHRFANGGRIMPEHQNNFRAVLDEKRNVMQGGADIFNTEAVRIRALSNEQKASSSAVDTLQLTANFIDYCVRTTTNQSVSLEGALLIQFELLLVTLDHFFKKMETSPMSFKPNDWYDLALLAYVQPGDKLWTYERRWLNLISEAGLANYLYMPPV